MNGNVIPFSWLVSADTRNIAEVQRSIVGFVGEKLLETDTLSEKAREAVCFAVRLAVEEALMNAVKHGCGSDPSLNVRIAGAATDRDIYVRIEDDGPGFEPGTVPDPTDPENLERSCGRGLLFMRYYMGEVCFNAQGNVVEMVKRFDHVPRDNDDAPADGTPVDSLSSG